MTITFDLQDREHEIDDASVLAAIKASHGGLTIEEIAKVTTIPLVAPSLGRLEAAGMIQRKQGQPVYWVAP